VQDVIAQLSGSYTYLNDATPFSTITIEVTNTGRLTSDYVGLLFLSSDNAGPAPRPKQTLISYARLHDVCTGAPQTLSLPPTLGSLARADADGNLVIYPGDYTISLDVDGAESFTFTLTGDEEGSIIDTLPASKASYPATVPVHLQAPSFANYGQPLEG